MPARRAEKRTSVEPEAAALWNGKFAVVETDRSWYLGTVKVVGDDMVLYTGMTGRPPVLPLADVESIEPADGHPHVVPA